MPIPFTCPHCRTEMQVDDQYAGQSGPCANCGKKITIPDVSPSAPAKGSGTATAAGLGLGLILLIAIPLILLMVVVVIGILIALLLPAVQSARQAARGQACANSLKQIGLALHNYHEMYGTFPPAYIADEDGKPMHSWRVLLLPFVEQSLLYEQYDFNEPWNSPQNLAATQMVIPAYRCPDARGDPLQTSYMVVDGEGLVFDGDRSTPIRDVLDGTSNTIVVVEVHGKSVGWAEPKDLTWNDVQQGVAGLQSPHGGGVAHVLFGDGSVRKLDATVSAQMLRAALTKAGGEPPILR